MPQVKSILLCLIYNSQNLETTQVSINRRMDQQAVVYSCDGMNISQQ